MARQTSINAYNKIKEDGLLGTLQWLVYDLLYQHGPLTQGELWSRHSPGGHQRHSIAPRFAELNKMGVITVLGQRPCALTKVVSLVWDVTDKLPVKPERKETKPQIIARQAEEISQLKARIAYLEKGPQQELF